MTVPHGHLQGGTGHLLLFDIIQSVYFSAITDTINWLKVQPVDLPWLRGSPNSPDTGIQVLSGLGPFSLLLYLQQQTDF